MVLSELAVAISASLVQVIAFAPNVIALLGTGAQLNGVVSGPGLPATVEVDAADGSVLGVAITNAAGDFSVYDLPNGQGPSATDVVVAHTAHGWGIQRVTVPIGAMIIATQVTVPSGPWADKLQLVSVKPDGQPSQPGSGSADYWDGQVSDNGRFVAFLSDDRTWT